ncbi:MAG: hypothetical protein K2X03_24990 [Bryobacteraceae bacterium]|nr:hypothetical protein [Bryobacteraceae bacterium]
MARSVFRIAFILFGLGSIGFVLSGGLPGALSFVIGATASLALLFLLHRTVRLLDITGSESPSRGAMFLLGFGQLAVFAVVYGILQVYEVSYPAMGTGLFVGIAAITLETVWGLLRKSN